MHNIIPSLHIVSPGALSLLQDAGRFGHGQLGLTQGGPLDGHSFRWANALVGNPTGTTVIEHSLGGLILRANTPCTLAVTGAVANLTLNNQPAASWQALTLTAGDEIALPQLQHGLRAYIAVAGGIAAPLHFGSSATVMREGIGGLAPNAQGQFGQKLHAGADLPLGTPSTVPANRLPDPVLAAIRQRTLTATTPSASPCQAHSAQGQPASSPTPIHLRLLEGYQVSAFSAAQRARFYLHCYEVTRSSDRMGYKLSGPAIHSHTRQLLSEGISYGAVQIPPDGQPIVLLNDRQTLGGYPKIGNVLSLDCWALAQAAPGTPVQFSPICAATAHNLLQLDAARFQRESALLTASRALS